MLATLFLYTTEGGRFGTERTHHWNPRAVREATEHKGLFKKLLSPCNLYVIIKCLKPYSGIELQFPASIICHLIQNFVYFCFM